MPHSAAEELAIDPGAFVERHAQQVFARLLAESGGAAPAPSEATESSAPARTPPTFADVDPDSLELTQPRSIGVEHVALAAMRDLDFEPMLKSLGIIGVHTAICGLIIARMAVLAY